MASHRDNFPYQMAAMGFYVSLGEAPVIFGEGFPQSSRSLDSASSM